MKPPRISVIMPFLNAEQYIQEAIDSVFAQTTSNWELLLVDDGSTDKSPAIALRYAKQNPCKVRYLHHPDHQTRGTSASRNLGIRHSKGEYIAFLDADDVWLSHKLEQQTAILDFHPEAAMIYGHTKYWFSWTGRTEDRKRDFIKTLDFQVDTLIEPPRLLALCLMSATRYPCICSVLVRRDAIVSVGGFEDHFPACSYEDLVLHSKIFLNAPVFVSSECWDMYRQHPNSCCAVERVTGQTDSARHMYFEWLRNYLLARDIKDPQILSLIQRKQWRYRHSIIYKMLTPGRRALTVIARHSLPAPVRHRIWKRWTERVEDFIN